MMTRKNRKKPKERVSCRLVSLRGEPSSSPSFPLPRSRYSRFVLTLHPTLPLIRLFPVQEPQILPSLAPLARPQPDRQSSHQRQPERPSVVDLVLLGPETRSIGEEGQAGAETEDGEGENEVVVGGEEGGEARVGSCRTTRGKGRKEESISLRSERKRSKGKEEGGRKREEGSCSHPTSTASTVPSGPKRSRRTAPTPAAS